MRPLDLRLFAPRAAPRAPAPRLAHGDRLTVEGRPVRLAVNPRARRVSLRLDVARREVVATAPSPARLRDALAFARIRAAWIAERLDGLPRPRSLQPGAVVPVRGEAARLERGAGRGGRFFAASSDGPARLVAAGEGEAFARAVVRLLRAEAAATLAERTADTARRLGHPAPEIAVGDPRGRWGSCRAAREGTPARIRYSWRLICAPPFVLDYVVAHECAHLIEPNHAAPFWALTRALYGDVDAARAWLRTHGPGLHAVG